MIDLDTLDWSKCTFKPYDHQIVGVHELIKNKAFGILDEMGAGKTKQVIDTACFLYQEEDIDTVFIICPAQVKDVWIHPQYSQIIEHSFVQGIIHEFTRSSKQLPDKEKGLTWVIVSVELLRRREHVRTLHELLRWRKVWIIVDESSTISNFKAEQTKGTMALVPRSKRRTILNGTPYGNSILNLYSQFAFLDPGILGFKNYYAFRNHHVSMGGYMGKQVMGYHHLDEIQEKIKPYVLRRLKKDCLDLPEKIRLPLIEVRLTPTTWEKYISMREEFVAYLNSSDEVSIVTTAPVKSLRLAQICSGFLGGFHVDESEETTTVEISSELTDSFLENLAFRINQDERFWLIVWCRFRPEIARLKRKIDERFPQIQVQVLQGGLSKAARDDAKTLFHPDGPDPKGPAVLIGQPQAGRFGSNFAKCSNVDYISHDYSQLTRAQSEDRVDRPGQRNTMNIQDYVVVGPNRERTISGMILKSLRKNEDMARWVCRRWVDEIYQEENDVPF
jgi:SNF2 family DNA or RNA helicase